MRGRKPESRSTKINRGTFRPCRDLGYLPAGVFGPPVPPDWLTPAGEQIWTELIKDAAHYGITDLEATMFANLCNWQGCIADCFRAGITPPASALAEVRRMMQALSLFAGSGSHPACTRSGA
jgi:hypothetical protein